jgi:hypothetical protein
MSLEKNRATHANKTILPLKLNDVVPVAKMSNENVFWQQVGRINGIHGFTGGRGEGIRKIKKSGTVTDFLLKKSPAPNKLN